MMRPLSSWPDSTTPPRKPRSMASQSTVLPMTAPTNGPAVSSMVEPASIISRSLLSLKKGAMVRGEVQG